MSAAESSRAMRQAMLSNADVMTRPIGETGWTRQRILDIAKTSGKFVIPYEDMKKCLKNAMAEMCKARILCNVSNARRHHFYIFHREYKKEISGNTQKTVA